MSTGQLHIDGLLRQKQELDKSIEYASYIQKALLPSEDDLQSILPQHFIYYVPCHIVSGDFYWIDQTKDIITVAVGDCTGHGVPGAFLSILGLSFLNLVFAGNIPGDPSEILNDMREYIKKSLSQKGVANERKDGIDLSMVRFNKNTGSLKYSGSFSPAYVIKDGELIQLLGNRMPVGIDTITEKPFESQEINLSPGNTVYLFTDGFPDQFGGEKGKKFKYPAFRALLLECSKLPISKQYDFISSNFSAWKGNYPLLDDVTIFGLKA